MGTQASSACAIPGCLLGRMWSLEARTTNSGSNTSWRWVWRESLEVSSISSSAAARPSSSRGWRTDDSGTAATVCVDTGHHAPGTNIEFIVTFLLRAVRLGAFDFNSRFYADDDLMVGAADPFQLFRIMYEVVRADALDPSAGIAFMLDQSHNIEPKIPAIIRSVMNVQEATAKALLVDRAALSAAQQAGDVLAANAVFMDAYATDVRPLLVARQS
jgi:L-rhamnose isomerase